VKNGGFLVYCGRDNDPFQTVTEWWNTGGMHYKSPSEHLFEQLGLGSQPTDGQHSCGNGWVLIIRHDPKQFVLEQGGDIQFFGRLEELCEQKAGIGKIDIKNYFRLTRGSYELASVMDEGIDNKPYIFNGLYIDLFNPTLPVITQKQVNPGEQAFLFNLATLQNSKNPKIVAAAGRAEDEKIESNSYCFILKSPLNTTNFMRVYLPQKPSQIKIDDALGKELSGAFTEWNELSNTCLLKFENHPDGIKVTIAW
jgi:hypothetical protein